MIRFGDELREAREAREVSLEEISGRTRVSVRYLAALEAGDYAAMPGGVFLKGSLRGYLDALHLDASAWMPRFEESLQRAGIVSNNPEWTEFAEAVHRNRVVGAPGRRKRWLGVVALLLLLALATLGTWKYVVQPRLAPPVAAPAVTGQAAPEQTSPGGGVTN